MAQLLQQFLYQVDLHLHPMSLEYIHKQKDTQVMNNLPYQV